MSSVPSAMHVTRKRCMPWQAQSGRLQRKAPTTPSNRAFGPLTALWVLGFDASGPQCPNVRHLQRTYRQPAAVGAAILMTINTR